MYPKNAASPERIAIGPVVQISDGAVQTSGVTVRVLPFGGSESDGGGSTAYSTDGVVIYTPTQAETNYTSFVLIAKKTGCIPASVTVVTSASNTAGYAGTDQSKILNPSSTVDLSGTSIKTATDIEADTQDIQTRLPAALVDGRIVAFAQAVGDKSGYSLTQSFPANFALLGIDGAGAILTVATVEELGVNALQANGLHTEIAVEVWAQDAGGTFPDGSLGDRVLISQNNTRALAVTGAGHIAAVLHDAEPNSIPEDAFVDAAISARALASDAATEISTAVGLLTPLVDLGTMIINDGTGTARYSVSALQNAPSGGGGGGDPWATDIATGYTGTQAGNILNLVKSKTDLITSGSVQTSLPVTQTGQITGPLFIGDDYLNANGRAFSWTVALPTGFVVGTSVCKFGMELAEGTGGALFSVTGTVIDAGGGNVTLRFDVPKATTETLEPGFYRWSVEIASAGGNEVTRVASDGRKLVEWREKQT